MGLSSSNSGCYDAGRGVDLGERLVKVNDQDAHGGPREAAWHRAEEPDFQAHCSPVQRPHFTCNTRTLLAGCLFLTSPGKQKADGITGKAICTRVMSLQVKAICTEVMSVQVKAIYTMLIRKIYWSAPDRKQELPRP